MLPLLYCQIATIFRRFSPTSHWPHNVSFFLLAIASYAIGQSLLIFFFITDYADTPADTIRHWWLPLAFTYIGCHSYRHYWCRSPQGHTIAAITHWPLMIRLSLLADNIAILMTLLYFFHYAFSISMSLARYARWLAICRFATQRRQYTYAIGISWPPQPPLRGFTLPLA